MRIRWIRHFSGNGFYQDLDIQSRVLERRVSFELSVIAGQQTTASAWLGIASGILGIFYGATAKQFRRFGGFSGREPEDFTPERRHRLYVIGISTVAVLASVKFLIWG
jgi:hypothetical protein